MARINRGPLAGYAAFTVNGEVWNVVGELTYQPSGMVNETLKGQSAVEGFSQMPSQGFVSASLRMRNDRRASEFQGASGLTVIAELANGVVVTCTDGWQVEEINVNTQEGTFELKIESASVTEDTVAGS